MHITRNQLKQIIKEEMSAVLKEQDAYGDTGVANAYRGLIEALVEFHKNYRRTLYKANMAGAGYEDGEELGGSKYQHRGLAGDEAYDARAAQMGILPWMSEKGEEMEKLLLKIQELHQKFSNEVARSVKIAMDKSKLPINSIQELLKMIEKASLQFHSLEAAPNFRDHTSIITVLRGSELRFEKFLKSDDARGAIGQKAKRYHSLIKQFQDAYRKTRKALGKYKEMIKAKS